MADIVRALQVEVAQGSPVYESVGGGFQRLRVQGVIGPIIQGVNDNQPILVIQGNNYFQFGPDEREEAEAFAEKLEAALEALSKNYRKSASAELSNLLADKPRKAK